MASGSQNMTTYKAKQLVNTYGSDTKPIYINAGVPTILGTIGGQYEPIYVNNGVITAITAGTTGQFYRGDKSWSNTLGGAFTANGTITANGGYLKATLNSNTVTIGSANAQWCHIENSANIPFYFNKSVHVDGDVYRYNTKVHMSSSGFHPPKNGGIYWDPYVESASDASDVTQIYQIASGVAGGTELRIQQANDSTDVINLLSPYYIYLNSKRAFGIYDSWLRINEGKGFSDGIYCGNSIVRTDNQFQVGSSGSYFYATTSETKITTMLTIVNNSSNNSYDAMVYLENKSSSDWAMKINCDGYDYGIDIVCASTASYALRASGTVRATSFVGPLTGNVTGNCSGSSGSCTGNAATATKLSNTPNNTTTFLRGDNTWSATLANTLTVNGLFVKGTGVIEFENSGSWGASNPTFPNNRGSIYWSGTSDWCRIFCTETSSDNFQLIIDFGDDTSPSMILRDRGTNKITLTPSSSTISATTFSGALSGNASTASKILDSNNSTAITASYASGGVSSFSWATVWNGYHLTYISKANLANQVSTAGYFISRGPWWSAGTSYNANDLHGSCVFAYTPSQSHANTATVGTLVAFDCNANGSYTLQLQGYYGGTEGALFYRNRNGDTGSWHAWSTVCNLERSQNFTGNKSWGSSGAGGRLNGSATNGGINSILIGDDVWLGDCNQGGIMGMKSTGANCGIWAYNSGGTNVGRLVFGSICELRSDCLVSVLTLGANAQAIKVKSIGCGDVYANLDTTNYKLYVAGNGKFTGNVYLDTGGAVLEVRYIRSAGYDTVIGSNGGLAVQSYAHNSWTSVRASAFTVQSSRLVKTNIRTMTVMDAHKILQLRPVNFDFKSNFGPLNQAGLIAEETELIMPNVVTVPENYDESKFDESKGINQPIKNIDYSKIVPYLIALAQFQNNEIEQLKLELKMIKNQIFN